MSEKIRKKTSIINNNIVYNYHKLDYNIVKSDAYKRFYKKEGFSINYLDIIKEENIDSFKSGEALDSYLYMGNHKVNYNGEEGISFMVWAPNAQEVQLVGDFNDWDGSSHKLENLNDSGIWSMFTTDLSQGDIYKYNVVGCDGVSRLKADPYGTYAELRPQTASKVFNLDEFDWSDKKYLEQKKNKSIFEQPMNIYEAHLGSWKRKWDGGFFNYEELYEMLEYCKDMGYTHIELMPITEYPLDMSWGYQTIGYYATTSRYGNPDQFKGFVNKAHELGIGIILDFAYSHFCKDIHGLYRFDGSAQYEYASPLKAENLAWGTAHFDVGKPEVKSFLLSNAIYWFKEYHVDGIRVDAVSSMLYLDYDGGDWEANQYGGKENIEAIDFLRKLNEVIYANIDNPIVVAEESTAWPMVTSPTYSGGLGFSYKWNMGWMNDTLQYMEKDPIYRKYHHDLITFSFMYAFSENFILPLSHDEVVHGKKSLLDKMPGDDWQRFANLRLLYAYYMIHPGKKLLFMGSEFAQGLEWRYAYGLEWQLLEIEQHSKMKDYVKDLNYMYKDEKSLYELDNTYKGFDFIDPNNKDQSIITLMRLSKNPKDFIIAVLNFTPNVYYDYKVGVPYEGVYEEILNSDNEKYYGSNQTMADAELVSVDEKWHNKPYHITIKVPPLGATFIKLKREKVKKDVVDEEIEISVKENTDTVGEKSSINVTVEKDSNVVKVNKIMQNHKKTKKNKSKNKRKNKKRSYNK